MLTRLKSDGYDAGEFKTEHMLGVARDAGLIAISPVRIYLVDVLCLPVAEQILTRIQPGLFAHFAYCRLGQRFFAVTAAGDGLSIARMIGALQQQHRHAFNLS